MALSGSFSAAYRGYTYKIEWKAVQSVSGNYSDVTLTHKLICASGYDLYIGSRSNTATVDGGEKSFTSPSISTAGNSTHTLGTTTHRVYHKDDGSKSCSIKGVFNIQATIAGVYKETLTVSSTITLDTIARASQPSCVTWPEHTQDVGDFGDTISIHMNRKSDSFTHTVRYAFGDLKGTIATEVTTGTTWTIPLSFMDLLPSSLSGSGTIYVDTYNGSTLVGTKYCGFTATVPASVVPKCSIQVLDATSIKDTYGTLVKGFSKFYVKVTGTPAYKSPIASYAATANGSSYNVAEFTTGVLSSAGTLTVSATVTDKRGRKSAAASASFSVADYAPPKITALTVHRCDEDGTENEEGEFIRVVFSATATSLNSKNTTAFTVRYKKSTATGFTAVTLSDLANKYSVSNRVYIFAADSNSSYDVEVEIKDSLSPAAKRATSASTAFTLMNWGADGKSLGLFKVAEKQGLDMGADIFMNFHKLMGAVGVIDTRSENNTPGWYMTNYGAGIVSEFKQLKNIGFAEPASTYGPVLTLIPWKDSSGTYPRQISFEAGNLWARIGTSETSWGAWVEVNFNRNKLGNAVSLIDKLGAAKYYFPSDGYLVLRANWRANSYIECAVYGTNDVGFVVTACASSSGDIGNQTEAIFVKKGMFVTGIGTNDTTQNSIVFHPLY